MKTTKSKKQLPAEQSDPFLALLKCRFEENSARHPKIKWEKVNAKLAANPEALWSLHEMERTGGEPDVIGVDQKTGEYIFVDCSPETPKGRVSLCYDREGLESRKEHKPKHTAVDLAAEMGIQLLTETEYHHLQTVGEFDLKTSSWLKTPDDIRALGGAIFGDRRFGRVFIYHNGAQSYYGSRGFRGSLRV